MFTLLLRFFSAAGIHYLAFATVVLGLMAVSPAQAADGDFVWARHMGGAATDSGEDVAVDSSGNVYTTGYFTDTADFNPGAGTSNLTSAGHRDIFVTKFDSSGNLVWVRSMGGISTDEGRAIAVDASGNVLVTGSFRSTVDFDSGPGTSNLTAAGGHDAFVLKLDGSGNFMWARGMRGTETDVGHAIAVDSSGNVYTTGYFGGATDFDTGAGTGTLTSVGDSNDIFLWKIDGDGNTAWAHSIGGTSTDVGEGLTVDPSGNVYTTGYFVGTVDFNPGAGTTNLASSGHEGLFVLKLDSSGNFAWARRVRGTATVYSIAIVVDASGSVYTTGHFFDTTDFDPGAGISNVTPAGGVDIFVLKLDSSGNYVWARGMGGTSGDVGADIAIDPSGNAHITGDFSATADFDPGEGTSLLTPSGTSDIFVLKLSSSGDFLWVRKMGGTSYENPNGIAADALGNVYTTGYFDGRADFNPGTGTSNLRAAEVDIFISKLGPDITPPTVLAITPAATGPTNADSIAFDLAFSEPVINFDVGADLTITHTGTAHTDATTTGSGASYTVTVTGISGDGSFTLGVNTTSDVEDPAGNALSSSVTSSAVLIDNTAPTVNIGGSSASITTSDPVAYFVFYNGASQVDLDENGVVLNRTGTANGTVSVTGGGNIGRQITISGITGDGTLGISIGVGSASDAAGNIAGAGGPSDTFIVDNTAPTISIGAPSASVTNDGPVTYTVTYTGASNVTLTGSDINVAASGGPTGTVGVTGTGNTERTVTIHSIAGDGTMRFFISAGTATDLIGNSAAASSQSQSFTVDNTPPSVGVDSLLTGDSTPVLTGTYSDAASVSVVVNGQPYSATLGAGTWSVQVTSALPDDLYDVVATATDAAGNMADDLTSSELQVAATPPPAPAVKGGPAFESETSPFEVCGTTSATTAQLLVDGVAFPYTPGDTSWCVELAESDDKSTTHSYDITAVNVAGVVSAPTTITITFGAPTPGVPLRWGGAAFALLVAAGFALRRNGRLAR